MVGAVILLMPWHQSQLRKASIYKSLASVSAAPETQTHITKSGKPTRLLIPSVAIDLAVADGYVQENGEWVLSNDKAHYALLTPLVNNKAGNTVIYGHNTKSVFKPTSAIKVGDELTIKTDNKLWFRYRYNSDANVDPTDVGVLSGRSDKPRATLITCSGLFYQNRRLMTFELVENGEIK